MKKCIVLNSLPLTFAKSKVFNSLYSEYLKALNLTFSELKNAKSSNELHKLTYNKIRNISFLPSDIVQEARKDVWAKRKRIKNSFSKCSIRLNKRWFRFVRTKRGNPCFKITYTPGKSFAIPITTDKQFERFKTFLVDGWIFENISLLNDGRIAVTLEKEFPKPEIKRGYAIGVDIGSITLAAITIFDTNTSKVIKQLYFGRDVAIKQRKYSERRAYLQSLVDKGSERAKKSLKRLKHKQANFVKTRSDQIAKEIVNLAKSYNAYIAIEKLKNLRGRRGWFNKNANKKINRIPYARFKEFLKSNAEIFGIPTHEVDAYHTSKWCPHCGAVNNGHQSANYALYKCKKCGLIVNSDRQASLNIAIKSLLERASRNLTDLSHVQISKRRVPVDGLLRPYEVGSSNVAVQHTNQLMENQFPKKLVVYLSQ